MLKPTGTQDTEVCTLTALTVEGAPFCVRRVGMHGVGPGEGGLVRLKDAARELYSGLQSVYAGMAGLAQIGSFFACCRPVFVLISTGLSVKMPRQ